MEEIKNNAIEKTENVTKENGASAKYNKKQNYKKKSKQKELKRQRLAEERNQKKQELKLKREELKAEREERRQAKLEQRRLEKERRQKKHDANVLEKKAKKQELQAYKLKKREERLKRRELLKHETKTERNKRIAWERAQKLELRRQKLEDQKAKRLERKQEREQKRLLRNQERREKRKNNKGIGGWLAAVISLGVTVLVLAGMLTFSIFTPIDDLMLSNAVQEKSFYDLVGYVDSLDVNLSKLTVSSDSEDQQKILGDVRVQSNLATNSISSLALPDEDKFYTTKFINQVGDFAKYLNEKLIDGKTLTKEDKQTLNSMYKINNELKNELSTLASQIDENFDFRSLYENKQDNLIISKFVELESNATNYPHMIYDGAFSENAKVKEAKALKGLKEFSKMDAEKQLKLYFKDYNIKDIELTSEVTGTNVECYEFTCKTQGDIELTAEISKQGGKLLLFNHFKDCSEDKVSVQDCQKVAEEFLKNIGITNVRSVWNNTANNMVTFNYASVVNGIICYSDLIKVNVCKERGTVSAIETSAYYLNHTNRQIPKVAISQDEASKKLSKDIKIESKRLAIIPVGNNSEVLAYEFIGSYENSTYYVYVDAVTGKEVKIFKVVDTNNGSLVM
ncbi:MAG: germination protein YpeB [Clostridia bacterium]|nr:germination protein YpeB [Clostridia bacterium]